ncbi:PEP-CTERM sorting domain-containing protein [Pseudoduganella lutea]|uniref:PEP-CTERM sorting domain-containing protein n=1 Tax=Pseudoduganella lutea TaxID=321985 RepID=A0A4P6KSY6_9BURK|nr:PEP-CTERM sorting domain-containing protein [Pseudoduganella lutea]QBE62000.1 PEP-CTERM sorting domain-containing protein [Pseudoduganella lutea]
MRNAMAGFALGLLLSSPVPAATTIDTAAFTITYVGGPTPEDWSITQVDLFPGVASFSLDTLNQSLAVEAHDLTGAGGFAATVSWSALRLDIGAGYRVTRLSVTGIAFGELAPGQLPNFPPGTANNEANLYLTVGTSDTWGASYAGFQAENTVDVPTGPLDLSGTANVSISGMLAAQAWGVEGGGAFAESMASSSLRDLVLHVEVAPVPEPHAGLMLAAGLGVLGLFARRRRAPAPPLAAPGPD